MARVVLITGGNLDGANGRLRRARTMIDREIGAVVRCSRRYESRAWGFDAEKPFVNQVVVADTGLTPGGVLEKALEIELALGRDREAEEAEKKRTGKPYASRAMDIDILFYDDRVIDEPGLTIPHPLLHERDFVLELLNEAVPAAVHPVLGKTVARLWEERGARRGLTTNETGGCGERASNETGKTEKNRDVRKG